MRARLRAGKVGATNASDHIAVSGEASEALRIDGEHGRGAVERHPKDVRVALGQRLFAETRSCAISGTIWPRCFY